MQTQILSDWGKETCDEKKKRNKLGNQQGVVCLKSIHVTAADLGSL